MISLTVALEATYTLWPRDAPPREVPAVDFVTGNNSNVLRPGELLRSIKIPASRTLKALCVSARVTDPSRALGCAAGRNEGSRRGDLLITITAATPRPVQLHFAQPPSATELRRAIDAKIPADCYFDDVHGSAPYKRHLTAYFAEQIRAELACPGSEA